MGNACRKMERLRENLRRRNIDPEAVNIGKLAAVLSKRTTDKRLNDIIFAVIEILEPEPCRMTHCKEYGGASFFCGCGLEKIPGRCKIHQEYKKRMAARAALKLG